MIRRLLLAVAASMALLPPAPSMAFDKEQLQQLIKTKKCTGCDLTGAWLYWADLDGADLSDANLSGAYLGFAHMKNANLRGANLTGADLTYTILSGATWVDGRICAELSVGECK